MCTKFDEVRFHPPSPSLPELAVIFLQALVRFGVFFLHFAEVRCVPNPNKDVTGEKWLFKQDRPLLGICSPSDQLSVGGDSNLLH